jgi:hypothetical protein
MAGVNADDRIDEGTYSYLVRRIVQLVRPQLVQQLDAAIFEQVSVHGRECLVYQSSVNGFTEIDKLCGLNREIRHSRPPSEPEDTE